MIDGVPGGTRRSDRPPRVAVDVLGHVRARVDDRDVDLGGLRQRAVLALLVVARGEFVSTERMVDAVWAAYRPASPLASLQSFVSRLRRALEPHAEARSRGAVVVSGATGYALRLPADAVDAWRFERLVTEGSASLSSHPAGAAAVLAEAVALWRGPALAEYADEAWARPEISRLAELRAIAREQLLAARLATGDAAVLVPDLEALVDEAPLREERWRLLAVALYRAHRQADALAALRRARTRLADELGVDPGPALRAVEEQILAHSPALEPGPAPAPSPAAPVSLFTAAPSGADDPLVERRRELHALQAALAAAAAGSGSLTVVEGPAGIGKSRLLVEARRCAAELGMTVLAARATQLEQEFSFGVARQLFEAQLVDTERRANLLRAAAASAAPVFDLSSGTSADDSSFAMLHGLYWLTANLAEHGPVAVVVDDIHWSDTGSLRFLAYLARRLEGLGIAVVAAFRTGEQHVLGTLIDELREDVGTLVVRPIPLTPAAVAEMIAARLGVHPDTAFVDACFEGTTGNPLLVRQLLRALEADAVPPDRAHADVARTLGSRAVSGMVLLRMRRLPTESTLLARALAVLGDGAALPHVAELAGVAEARAAELTATLVTAEILRPYSPLAFVHPLVRDGIYADVPPGERELLHEAAAHILERAGRSDEQVAAQLLQAPRRGNPWVVEVLRRAARDAVRRGSADGAVTLLTRALEEPPSGRLRGDVTLELGLVETSTDGVAAGRHLEAAYDQLDDDDARARAAVALTRTLVFVGEFGSPVWFAAAALNALPTGLVEDRAAVLAYQRIGGQMHSVDADVWDFAAPPPVPGEGYGSRLLQAALAYDSMCGALPRPQAVALADAALSDGQLVTADPGLLWVWAQVVLDLADEDVLPMWDTINADAHQRGSLFSVLAVGFWRAWSLGRRGELAEAEQSIRTGIEQLGMWQPDASTLPYGRATLARILFYQGHPEQAWSAIGDVRSPSAMDGERLLVETEAELLLDAGDAARALDRLELVTSRVPQVVNPAWRRDRVLWCVAAAACGRAEEAQEQVDELLALARRWGAPGPIGEVLLAQGRILGRDGVDAVAEAAELLASAPRPLIHADALIALGAASAARDRKRAAAALHHAHDIGVATGAYRLVEHATAVLERNGLDGPPAPARRRSRLTTIERRILELAELGADVREIGQRLFLAPGTVQHHLEHARTRTGL